MIRNLLGAGLVLGALAVGAAPLALAAPPDCSAADIAEVSSGVSAATSAYLFAHPDVNAFFTGLEGAPRDQMRADIRTYFAANPQVKTDLQGIRQPLMDLRNRCNAAQPPA